jgi:hypothetical protein
MLGLSACGQKGGLYIPQETPPPKSSPAASEAPAPAQGAAPQPETGAPTQQATTEPPA